MPDILSDESIKLEIHTHTHTHIYIYAHTHTHTQTYIDMCIHVHRGKKGKELPVNLKPHSPTHKNPQDTHLHTHREEK